MMFTGQKQKDSLISQKEVPYNPDALYKSRIVNQSYTLKWYRRIGKTVKHATNYKMGPYMLQFVNARRCLSSFWYL